MIEPSVFFQMYFSLHKLKEQLFKKAPFGSKPRLDPTEAESSNGPIDGLEGFRCTYIDV